MPVDDSKSSLVPPPDDKQRVQALVAACIEAMEQGDADPVPRICAQAPDLATRVQRRLAQLVLSGLIRVVTPTQPSTIGPYRIVRELGSGGMGTVYLAEQQDPVRRQVALKVIKLGMDTHEVVQRFSLERQTLAAMSHPHIAQVFEAGATVDGRPYFVMEFVAGTQIRDFCDERRLGLPQRLRLLATVARAVQHAHDRGVIHRDIKPSNILVAEHDRNYAPKIIDFGVAKATGPIGDSYDLRTRADQVLGTPEYMSPEQACSGGIDVDVRTDIYSLGVVLYELLCGQLPFESSRLRAASRRELEHILQEEPPSSPSTRLRAASKETLTARGLDAGRLGSPELDWIALKALAKQRSERYASASALADDLERWLRHDPIVAAPPRLGYHLRKFVRRHRVPVLAAMAVFAALSIGLALSVRSAASAHAAQQQEAAALADMRAFYELARDAVGRFVDVANERLANLPRTDSVRKTMLGEAMEFYGALQRHRPADPAVRVDILFAEERLGQLQRRLGLSAEALVTLQGCVAGLAALRRDLPSDARLVHLHAIAQNSLAEALTGVGQSAAAVAAFEAALNDIAALRSKHGGSGVHLDRDEARVFANLAAEHGDRPDTALDCLGRSLAAWQRVSDAAPGDITAIVGSSQVLGMQAEVLTKKNRLSEAAMCLQRAMQRLAEAPADRDVRERTATVYSKFGDVQRRLRKPAEARSALQRAVELYAELTAEHPDTPTLADHAAGAWVELCDLANDQDDQVEAQRCIDQALAIRRRIVAAVPHNPRLRMMLVRTLQKQIAILTDLWQHHDGTVAPIMKVLAEAVEQIDPLQVHGPADVEIGITYAVVHEVRAAILDSQRDHTAAHLDHEAAHRVLTALLNAGPDRVEVRYQLAGVCSNLVTAHWYQREFAAGIAVGEEGIAHLRAGLAIDARHVGLQGLAAKLVVRTASAYEQSGDEAGQLRTLMLLVEVPEFGQDAHETGAMVLGQEARDARGAPLRNERLERAEKELRACIARRGNAGLAIGSDGNRGLSATLTRQRDLDLYIVLEDVLGELGDQTALEPVIDAALGLVQEMPGIGSDRVRTVYDKVVVRAIRAGDLAKAAERLEEMLARIGPKGKGNYLAACLFAQIAQAAKDTAGVDASGRRAVECLTAAVEQQEVDRRAIAHPNFAHLRNRADYLELLEK